MAKEVSTHQGPTQEADLKGILCAPHLNNVRLHSKVYTFGRGIIVVLTVVMIAEVAGRPGGLVVTLEYYD